MDDHRQKGSSGDKFSFPNESIQTHQEFEFEFGSATPRSPNSPADHLFSNGKLLPHSFIPVQPRNSTNFSRSMSISSKDSSFLSSRSNSTNSSSSCSSARTSVSIESSSSERKVISQGKDAKKIPVKRERKQGEKPVLSSQQYGSSQRWQIIAVPVPALSRQSSRIIKKGGAVGQERLQRTKKKSVVEDKSGKKSKGFCRGFFASFVSKCHAMNPSRREHVLDEDLNNFR